MSLQQKTGAIVPYRAATPQVVQFAADGIAADLRVAPLDRRSRSSLYTIRLAASDESVVGRLIGVLPSGDAVDLGDLAVAPGSIGSARLAVSTPHGGGYRAVYLEIRSDRVLLAVEAPKPPPSRRVPRLAAAVVVLALGVVSLAGGVVALAFPQPPVLHGPEHATAGDTVHVHYAARGYGTERYTARYDDGIVFASGALAAKDGELALALPDNAVNRRVWLAVTTEGLLGTAAGVTSFPVVAQRSEDVPARVLSFSARRDPGPDGQTVLASYLAVADRGTLTLQDQSGNVIATAPFTHVGTSRLPVPAPYRDRSLTARIGVEHGRTHAVASIALPALERQAPAPPPPAATPGVPSESAGMLTFDERGVAGSRLAVRVMPHRTAMTVAMQDASGETLAERDISPGETSVTLPLPDRPAMYFLLLRYDGEDGTQTVVRPVRVVAATGGQAISR